MKKWRASLFLSFLIPASFASDLQADVARDFERAASLSRQGHEEQAKISWMDFLRRYPNHDLTDNAHLHLADLYQRQALWEQAVSEYRKVFQFPRSDIIPQAAFELGNCLLKLKGPREARIEWSALVRKYPKTEAARLAQLKLMGLEKDK